MKIDGKLVVDKGEWAKKKSEEGFGVVAVLCDGSTKVIGTTRVEATEYKMPECTIAIAHPVLDSFGEIKKIEVFEIAKQYKWQTSIDGFGRWLKKISDKWKSECVGESDGEKAVARCE